MSDTALAQTIYQEMLAHPALFAHPRPQHVAIIGDTQNCILQEVLKHPTITEIWQISSTPIATDVKDVRVNWFVDKDGMWVTRINPQSFDIIIIAQNNDASSFAPFFKALRPEGILIQPSDSMFNLDALKSTQQALQTAGFFDIQPLHFPQPQLSLGWRAIFIAKKQGVLRKIREKDIYNKSFITQYYNYDIHKAALAVPEFMRTALIM